VGDIFIWLSGASKKILRECPTERPRLYGLGAMIAVTGGLAGVSLAFALVNALKVNLPAVIVFGVLWALAVMMIDRLFVVSMHRQRNPLIYLIQALPRLAMAIVLGFVISTPFVLQIFKPEITDQIQKNQEAQRTAYYQNLKNNPFYIAVQQDRANVDKLTQEEGGAGAGINITTDSELVSLQSQQANAKTQLAYWTDELNCQLYGHTPTGKSCKVGYGPVATNDQKEVASWQTQVSDLNTEITQRTQALQKENAGAQQATANSAKTQLVDAQQTLQNAQKQLSTQTQDVNDGIQGDSGILAQLSALGAVTAGNSTLQWARLLLFLLFLIIDILPVFTKLLLNLLPATTYDKILAEEEESFVQAAEDVRAVRRATHRAATAAEAAGVRQRNAAWSAPLPGQYQDIMELRRRVNRTWLERRESELMRDIANGDGLIGSGSMPSFDGWHPSWPPPNGSYAPGPADGAGPGTAPGAPGATRTDQRRSESQSRAFSQRLRAAAQRVLSWLRGLRPRRPGFGQQDSFDGPLIGQPADDTGPGPQPLAGPPWQESSPEADGWSRTVPMPGAGPGPGDGYRPEPKPGYRPEPPAGYRAEPLAGDLPAPDPSPGPDPEEPAELPETAGMPVFPLAPDGADGTSRPVPDQPVTRLDIEPLDGRPDLEPPTRDLWPPT
jgi:hypothetical protein